MPLIEKLKSVLGGEEEEQRYSHQCSVCETRFESSEPNPNHVSCPDCGSNRIHTVT